MQRSEKLGERHAGVSTRSKGVLLLLQKTLFLPQRALLRSRAPFPERVLLSPQRVLPFLSRVLFPPRVLLSQRLPFR